MATLAAREAGWCSKAAQWRSSGPSLAGLWELGGPPVGPPHTQAAAPGASLTLGTLTTNVLQERKPSFPDLTPCDLRPRFLKGSGARQVREGRGHHSPGGFFNRLPFCKDRPSGTRHRPAWTCTKSGTGASGSSPTRHKQLGRWTFLRSPCDFFFF